MQSFIDLLSIWEISHRWYDHDPNLTDPKALPLDTQDLLRFITRLMYYHNLSVFDKSGHEFSNASHLVSFKDYDPFRDYPEDKPEFDSEQDYIVFKSDKYGEFEQTQLKMHDEYVENFEQCFRNRIYNKSELEKTHLSLYAVEDLCINYQIDPPAFWFNEKEILRIKKSFEIEHEVESLNQQLENAGNDSNDKLFKGRHADSKLDKELCRAIAATLWSEYPEMTIAAITSHKAIQQYGNGAQYRDKDTIRNWIKDLDPRPENERRGRPKKEIT